MIEVPVEAPVPPNSKASALLEGASFYDCWRMESPYTDSSAMEFFLAAAARSPRWVNIAMSARNRIVRMVGLKHLGKLDDLDASRPAQSYRPGDRDKHLDVVLSVHRAMSADQKSVMVSLTTIVHVKNLLGRLYMLPVTPAHRIIAPAVLGRIRSATAGLRLPAVH